MRVLASHETWLVVAVSVLDAQLVELVSPFTNSTRLGKTSDNFVPAFFIWSLDIEVFIE